ncbi:hypothetical protein JQW41_20945 [Sulfitobacter pseudonitzschiae]|nr:hypothetical protein [Pseudosulfitobacter pseudonitzschiae]MBM1817353.1 hypothetical protein [Pseudosulfitobacter pseudonitzschiae]MBM1858815.1 hypothetical protein [Pseudosulfitobacter pseudonitzschiae]MBM1883028.1 hypothetical protein [Pseudosulfitobacter pseudonitzschiae]MBM1887883.1 hypothetical protein [Pseudosulfitobacter pseudonitzschiae]MBM1984619.1 hypothetical protein [Pseudosulfitobacter pseudonitzschiae]
MDRSYQTKWRAQFQHLEGAYGPATMRSYYSDVEAFESWCHDNELPPFPAAVSTVCSFLEAQGQAVAPSTVRRRLYGIRKVHRLLDIPDPTLQEDVNLAIRKVRRLRHNRPTQAKGMTCSLGNLNLLHYGLKISLGGEMAHFKFSFAAARPTNAVMGGYHSRHAGQPEWLTIG